MLDEAQMHIHFKRVQSVSIQSPRVCQRCVHVRDPSESVECMEHVCVCVDVISDQFGGNYYVP